MTFCYHMYGVDVADMNVYIKETSRAAVQLWRQSGNTGNRWINATVPVPPGTVTGSFSVFLIDMATSSFWVL